MAKQPELLVFSEDERMLKELLSKGRELSDKAEMQLTCILAGGVTEDLVSKVGEFGADTMLIAKSDTLTRFDSEVYCALIANVAKDRNPEIILIGATKRGKELAPRLATRLGTGCMADCIALDIEPATRSLIATRLMYAGKATAKENCKTNPQIATVLPRVFETKTSVILKSRIVEVAAPSVPRRVTVKEIRKKEAGVANIEDASVVVCGGRGIRSKGDFELLQELAKVLNGQIGCSRPIAADLGWFPEWIGLSGHKVHPTLYVGCGVSGAIQHLAGIRDARTVVAINGNPDAPIFSAVDYGVVGDLYQVVPALTESIRKKL